MAAVRPWCTGRPGSARFNDSHVKDARHFAGASWTHWASSLPLLVLLVLALGACGSSATSDRPRDDTAAPPADAAAAPTDLRRQPAIARADPRQRANFALLRTPPEGLPARVGRLLDAPIVGMNWRLAQRIPVNLSGAYWLVPGDGHLCIVDHGSLGNPAAGTSCARTADALTQGVASITVTRPHAGVYADEARLIVGVAPDGADEVRIRTRDAVARAPVVGSTFVLRDALVAPPDKISWR
jgi:hypothetical protein